MREDAKVTHNELLQRLNDPWLALVDVLPVESYDKAHIPGAIHLPLPAIRESGRSVLRDLNREIVVYCEGPSCPMAAEAVALLKELGYRNVRRLEEGISGWKKNGGTVARPTRNPAATPPARKKTTSLAPRLVLLEKSSFLTLLGVWLCMVLIFGLAYTILPMLYPSGSGLKENAHLLGHSFIDVLTAIYFSFVTATSVGFGDVVPVGANRVLAVIESGLALLLFGVIVTKLVQSRQEELIEETHRIAFEDRLARVRSNLHFVLMELQQIETECHRAFAPDRVIPRLEGVIMVFVGELKSIYDLLQRPHETPMETMVESMLASLTANLRQLRDLLDRSQDDADPTDTFAALAFNAVLSPHLKSIHRLAADICTACTPKNESPELKYWLDQIEELSQFG